MHQQPWTVGAVSDPCYDRQELVGIALELWLELCIAAVHHMGLVTLTHTPSAIGLLVELLERPANEKASRVMSVGYPVPRARVPDLKRGALEEVAVWRSGALERPREGNTPTGWLRSM